MIGLISPEKKTIDDALCMHQGYVLDFSNRTIEEYFEEKFKISFYAEEYQFNGDSKAKRLRAILAHVQPEKASAILKDLWEYRSTLPDIYRKDSPDDEDRLRERYFQILLKLQTHAFDSGESSTDSLDQFEDSETLGNLITSIERDVRAGHHAAALDRLHTYCQKKFRFLLEQKGRPVDRSEPLNSRAGAYVKILETEHDLSEMTIRIIKSSISIFERFNSIRNDRSFAHDNDLIDAKEARFIFDSISALLRFMKAVQMEAFGD